MNTSRLRCLLTAALIVFPLCAHSQIADITDQTSNPVPGSGHDYIRQLAETVNPANGSLSVRIQIPTAAARGFTLPFAFGYDSNGIQQPTPATNGTTRWLVDKTLYSLGGWSPSIVRASRLVVSQYSNVAGQSGVCNYSHGYVFVDVSGGRHALHIGESDRSTSPNQYCSSQNYLSGGDEFVSATLDAPSAGNAHKNFTVSDQAGTRYFFPQEVFTSDSSGDIALPSTIEDRNGNITSLSIPSTGTGGSYGAFNVVDSLGRTALSVSGVGAKGSNNTNTIVAQGQSYTVTWSTTTAQYTPNYTDFSNGLCSVPPAVNNSVPTVSSIGLPNGKQYRFYYGTDNPDPAYRNSYGLVSEIDYPTGAKVKYKWMLGDANFSYLVVPVDTPRTGPTRCVFGYSHPVIQSRTVTLADDTSVLTQTFSYTTAAVDPSNDGKTTPVLNYKTSDVTTKDLVTNKSSRVHYVYSGMAPLLNVFYGDISNQSITLQPFEQSIQLFDGSSATALQTTTKAFVGSTSLVLCQFQTRDDGLSAGHFYEYDSYSSQLSDDKEYGYGQVSTPATACVADATAPSGFDRETATQYTRLSSPQGVAFSVPSITKVTANNVAVKETDYLYDGQAALDNVTGLPSGSHDETLYPASIASGRGNRTKVTEKCSPDCTDVVKTMTYDSTGQLVKVTDSLGATSMAYTDSPTGGNAGGNSNAYLTKVTRQKTGTVSHIQQWQYNYATGKMVESDDENSQPTTYEYNDTLLRLTDVYGPPSPQNNNAKPHTTYAYTDGANPSVTVTGPTGITTVSVNDGLGRQTGLQTVDAGSTDTAYDGLGRVISVSNPYASASDTKLFTGFAYDALNRKTMQCGPDNGTDASSCSAGTSYKQWSYSGPATTFSDESGKTTKLTTDSLGRLSKVVEDSASLKLATTYAYNSLDSLTDVTQSGVSGETARTRSFTYDSLSRLVTSTNPETGTVCYGTWDNSKCINGYDGNGNLLAKTDARKSVTSYSYDALNRLISKSRSGGSTDSYFYDGDTGTWAANYMLGSNLVGRLSFIRSYNPDLTGGPCDINGTKKCDDQYFGYDTMGRLNHWTGAPPSEWGYVAHAIDAVYDLAGNVTSLTYPDGRTLSQGYDTAGRLQSVTDGNGQIYVNSIAYHPNGTPQKMKFSNGNMAELTSLNHRLQPCESVVYNGGDTNPLLDRQYFYGSNTTSGDQCKDTTSNNGNILHVLDGMNTLNGQNYTYDALNRIISWSGASPAGAFRQMSYGYDSFGNLTQASGATATSASSVYGANNRLLASAVKCQGPNGETGGYDAAGNILCTGSSSAMEQQSFAWDAEERITRSWNQQHNNPSPFFYTYDANGQRVRSDNTGPGTWREYSYFNGQVLAEKDNTGNWTDYIYANGKRLATVRPTSVLHHSGVCGNCVGGAQNFFVSQLAAELKDYTIRSGDKLVFQQKQTNARAGLYMYATDGTNSMCGLVDQNGDCMNSSSQADGTWKTRVVELSSWSGKQISTNLGVSVEANTPQGVGWDSQIADVAVVSNDGQVHTMFHGQPVSGSAWSPGAGSSFSTMALSTTASGPQAVVVSFTNDACSCLGTAASGDRNLFVTQVASGSNVANLSTSGGAYYDTCAHDNGNLYCTGSMTVTVPYGGAIAVRAHGTLADGIAPHMQVRVNGNLLGEVDVPEAEQTYTFTLGGAADTGVLTTYFAGDQVGTTQMEFANDAWPVQRTEFAPFGQELSNQNLSSNRYKFTGKERDQESGLDNFGARYYGSNMGRFMSPDHPLIDQHPENPQSWNLYAYARNNPLINIDPTGLGCVTDLGRSSDKGYESVEFNNSLSSDDCAHQHGTWVPGDVSASNTGAYRDSDGNINFQAVTNTGGNVYYSSFVSGAQTDANGVGPGASIAHASADWLSGQMVGGSLDQMMSFAANRMEPRGGGGLMALLAGPGFSPDAPDNWAGPGGMGTPQGQGDWAAMVHDYNFFTNNITIGTYFNPFVSRATAKALIQSDNYLVGHAGGAQSVKMGILFGVVNAFQWLTHPF